MFAKVVFCAVLVAVNAGIIGHGGSSVSSRRQDDFGNYAFNYQIVDGLGATNGRAESGDAWGNKVGSYNLADIDGRARSVHYVADGAGFRAVVKTNEPGTAHSAPAASLTASTNPGHVSGSPAVIAHAPVAAIAAPAIAAAPVVAAAPAIAAAPALAAAAVAPAVAHAGVLGAHAGVLGAHAGVIGAHGLIGAHPGVIGAHHGIFKHF